VPCVVDSSMAAEAGGCFPGDATVTLETGQRKTMDNVTVGDRVMTYDALTGQFHYDAVMTFLHRSPISAQTTQYVTVETQDGHRLTLTPGTRRLLDRWSLKYDSRDTASDLTSDYCIIRLRWR